MAQTSRMAVLYRTNSFKVLDKAKVHFTFHGMAVKMALTAATTPGTEAARVCQAKRLSHFSEKLQGLFCTPSRIMTGWAWRTLQEYEMWLLFLTIFLKKL